MKDKLTSNIGLKVLSVILAAILWLVITNVDDPIETKPFRDVPVEILNEDVITELGKVYDIVQGETIDFTVEARRSIKDNLTVADFKVTADFTQLSDVYAVPIDITCPKYGDENVRVTDGKEQRMIISLEEVMEENFKVNIVTKGEVAEGYFVGKKSASPNIITVSGPKARIERISDVVVEVDVSGATESIHIVGIPKVLDEDGKEMDSSYFTFNENYISVSIDLYKTKSINLHFSTNGSPAEGYVMTNIEYEPKTIEVAGKEEDLRRIRYLSIKESIAGATGNIEKEINLQEKLPEGIILVGEDHNAVINITIEKMQTKEITIWPGDVEFRNKTEDYSVLINSNGPIIVSVMGSTEELARMSRTSLKPYVDLAGYGIGTYTKNIEFDLPEHNKITNDPEISFNLTTFD
ncbi:MAG: hypothetical protein GX306_10485 [Clostridiales bacterium]|jgi:YbbR domain-containing protein|nr:hypothetical protein [Clostridiales bacterium]